MDRFTTCDRRPGLRLLHTSDWHLGRSLHGRKRYDEFAAFLDWLAETIERERVAVVLVAGDVFDSSAPSNRAQQLYYRFIRRVADSACRHLVVIAGNHDSPTFLNAPRELLRALDVHVVGAATEDPADEVLVLRDHEGTPELIVCAVPYLRDRDIRLSEAGEGIEDKERKLIEGIGAHYAAIVALAEQRRAELERHTPIVGMGHLFTAGGQTQDGDGVRELYVGSLAHVSPALFPDALDYLALGHLHVPQRIGGSETRRYSGSPLPMGFGEAHQVKSVCLVDLSDAGIEVTLIDTPVFQPLERLRGSWEVIAARLRELADAGSQAWLEVVHDDEALIGDLRERLEEAVAGTAMEILRVRDNRVLDRALAQIQADEQLADLKVEEVFARCLAAHQIPEEQHPELRHAYREILLGLEEADSKAE
ncbi:exonuclease sbcCD subunit D [Thiocystis violacea]|nr:exonuclease sbcCD subunit D [Thiocystis violacea]